MIDNNIALLKKDLQEVLYLDLDDFGVAAEADEIVSRFIGFRLHSEFQPIRAINNPAMPLGFEASLRPFIGTEAVAAEFAFSVADNQGKLVKLDRIARTLHMLNYLNLPDNRGLLFVNVHPNLLVSVNAHGRVFERILHTRSVPTCQVVIEIVENAVEADRKLVEAVGNYRDCGYRIAIDGFGSKHSNFDRLLKLAPHYVKLDPSHIRRAQTSTKARRVLPKIIEIPQELGAQTIVAGIDNETQYEIARDAGATLVQGDFLGRHASANGWKKLQELPSDKSGTIPEAPFHFGSFSALATSA